MKKARKYSRRTVIILTVLILLLTMTGTAFAFYQSRRHFGGISNVKVDLLFDQLEPDALKQYQTDLSTTLTSSEKEWGHIGNPYIISDPRHLQNLSYLQNSGFFQKEFPALADPHDPGGNYTRDSMPYFLVCTPDYKPTVIDCGGFAISPIGTEEHPFIGSVKGVSTINPETGVPLSQSESKIGDLTTPVSALHNISVRAETDRIDIGLFGKISYLGHLPQDSASDPNQDPDASHGLPEFQGQVSHLEDIVFSDVQIAVQEPSLIDQALHPAHRWLKDLFPEIIPDPSADPDAPQKTNPDPEETHHIGIIVGHIEYVTAKNLSIYYTSSNIKAISVNDQQNDPETPNYLSSTGYFGLMDNLNPKPGKEKDSILVGSGLDSAELVTGLFGGGGEDVGLQPGYLRADEMYEKYCHYLVDNSLTTETGSIALLKAYTMGTVDGKPEKVRLAKEAKEDHLLWQSKAGYYISDNVFTFALSHGQDLGNEKTLDMLEDIWPDAELPEPAPQTVNIIPVQAESSAPEENVPDSVASSETAEGSDALSSDAAEDQAAPDGTSETEASTDAEPSDQDGPGEVPTPAAVPENPYPVSMAAAAPPAPYDSNAGVTLTEGSKIIPNIILGPNNSDWDYGQVNVQINYYQNLEQIKSTAQLDTVLNNNVNAKFYVGFKTSGSAGDRLRFIDVKSGPKELGHWVLLGQSSKGVLEKSDGQGHPNDRLVYKSAASRNSDKSYLLSIAKNSDGTYRFTAENGKILGMNYSGVLPNIDAVELNSSGQPPRHRVIDSTLTVRGDGIWEIQYPFIINPGSIIAFEEGEHGTCFGANRIFSGKTVDIYIYHATDEQDERKDPFYFVPPEGEAQEFPANEYVLWPNNQYTGDTSGKKDDNSYTLRHLSDLGWKDRMGNMIWPKTDTDTGNKFKPLSKMFNIKKAVDWGLQANLGGLSLGQISSEGKILQVQVGSDPSQPKIGVPTGALAFRINKNFPPEKPGYIRIIVKVPSLPFKQNIPNESGELVLSDPQTDDKTKDYYVGLWRGDPVTFGSLSIYGFNKNNADQFVEMPVSQQLFSSKDYTTKNPPLKDPPEGSEEYTEEQKRASLRNTRYINVNLPAEDGGPNNTAPAQYRAYLQGDSIMLAYEFQVTEKGVYILACSDSAMQIAYCSADGIASGGIDGSGGASLGYTDFVYDNGASVLPVTQRPDTYDPSRPKTPADFYYPSNVLVHFDNLHIDPDTGAMTYPRINQAAFSAYREIGNPKSPIDPAATFHLNREGADYPYIAAMTTPHESDIMDINPTESAP